MYILEEGSALANSDYVNSTGEVIFQRGETSHQISIQLRANNMNQDNTSFLVKLIANPADDVRIGSNGSVTVEVKSSKERGPFFPDTPVISNFYQGQGSLYYNLPLICITVSLYIA